MKKIATIIFLILIFNNGFSQDSIIKNSNFLIQQKVLETKIEYLEKRNSDFENQLIKQNGNFRDDLANVKEDFNARLNIYVVCIGLILSIIAVAINFFGKLAIKKRVEDIIQNTAESYAEKKTNDVLNTKITDDYVSKIIRDKGEKEISRLLQVLEQRGQETIDDIKSKGEKVINSVLAEPPTDKEIANDKKLSANEIFKIAFESNDSLAQTKLYQEVLELDPNNRNALNNIAVALSRQNRFTEAINYLNKSIAIFPDYALAYANRANAFNQLSKLELASKDVEKAIELNPNLEWAYSIKGNILTKQGEFEEAEKQLQKAIDINPNSPQAYFNLAYFREETGNYEQSALDYQKAQDLGFDNKFLLYNNLAVLNRRLGKYDKALEYLEKVKEDNPDFPNLYGTMALIYADQSDDENFYKYLEMALEKGCLVWNYLNDPGFNKYRDSERLEKLMSPYLEKHNA